MFVVNSEGNVAEGPLCGSADVDVDTTDHAIVYTAGLLAGWLIWSNYQVRGRLGINACVVRRGLSCQVDCEQLLQTPHHGDIQTLHGSARCLY